MVAMQVLVISDTHLTAQTLDRMPPEVWDMVDAADVVLHAGDVVDAAVLTALSERAELHAVLGNNDRAMRLPEVLCLDLDGVPIAMLHDSGARTGRERRMARRFPDAHVVVFGHSHAPLVQDGVDGQLLLNPGSPTQRRRQPVHTVGRLRLRAGAIERAEIVEVGPLAARSTAS
jgi:putative phosphoesterase